jgi:hypothetical protein
VSFGYCLGVGSFVLQATLFRGSPSSVACRETNTSLAIWILDALPELVSDASLQHLGIQSISASGFRVGLQKMVGACATTREEPVDALRSTFVYNIRD